MVRGDLFVCFFFVFFFFFGKREEKIVRVVSWVILLRLKM